MSKAQVRKNKRFAKSCFESCPNLESLAYQEAERHWIINGASVQDFFFRNNNCSKAWLIEVNLTEKEAVHLMGFINHLPKTTCSFQRKDLIKGTL